ncbi:hypothetical protein SBG_0625 [Salmonella bongori NCTC 12419]|uniref:Uncharacterized protein n=1 Tax=Salmonella bongori (strain ATCC 43975 / DSM 13772 / NCTC 12419) TaxID=218493 RepID=A0A0K0H8M5_SALBC|nr:hypothetical protein SBG_0625 [Salmonella bongori NCTC 12419]
MPLYQPFTVSLAPYCLRLPERRLAFSTSSSTSLLHEGFGVCINQPLPVCYLARRSVKEGDDLGTEQWALADNGLIYVELAANQELSNPGNVTFLSLITVLNEWVNTTTLLHNLLSGERVTP